MKLKELNLVLTLIALFLLLVLIFPSLKKQTGRAYDSMIELNPSCEFDYMGSKNPLPPGICCRELQKTIQCIQETKIKCYNDISKQYTLNKDQHSYCLRNGYEIPKII